MIATPRADRSLPADAVRTALRACVDVGALDPDVVIVEARRAASSTELAVLSYSAPW